MPWPEKKNRTKSPSLTLFRKASNFLLKSAFERTSVSTVTFLDSNPTCCKIMAQVLGVGIGAREALDLAVAIALDADDEGATRRLVGEGQRTVEQERDGAQGQSE